MPPHTKTPAGARVRSQQRESYRRGTVTQSTRNRKWACLAGDPTDYERTIPKLRAKLGDAAVEEEWGAALPRRMALSLAARCLA
jgi:hypothetical protein